MNYGSFFLRRNSANAAKRWSSLATWGGSFPRGRMPLTLTGGNILFDVSMIDADAPGRIVVGAGATLSFDESKPVNRLVCDAIVVAQGGRVIAGDPTHAYGSQLRIDICGDLQAVTGYDSTGHALYRGPDYIGNTPTGNDGFLNDGMGQYRGILAQAGGSISLRGANPRVVCRMIASSAPGAQYIDVDATVPASMLNATVMVSPDGFFNASTRTETRTITGLTQSPAGVGTTRISLSAPLAFARFGQIQYLTDTGLSLTPGPYTLFDPTTNPNGMRSHVGQESSFLYNRAVVAIFNHNLVISAYDLAGKSAIANGDGVHTMQMGLTSRMYMRDLTINCFGHRGLKGRYGVHAHQPSYNADGTPKNDGSVAGNLNSAFGSGTFMCNYGLYESHYDGVVGLAGNNRFAVLHATRGTVVKNCVAVRAKGHAFFEENGSEEENTVDNNLSMMHEPPALADTIQAHENFIIGDVTACGFWFANHFNTHTNNMTVDTVGAGWGNALSYGIEGVQVDQQHGCYGFSTPVPICPGIGRPGTWANNNSLCYGFSCFSLPGQTAQDGTGRNTAFKAQCSTNGVFPPNYVNLVLTRFHLHKGPAYHNILSSPDYEFPQQTDQLETMWVGTTHNAQPSKIFHPSCAYESLNHENHYLRNNNIFACAVTSYHGTLPTIGGTYYNFSGPIYSTQGGNHGAVQGIAVIESWDNYLAPIETYAIGNVGWRLCNSNGVWQTPPSHLTQSTTLYDAITGTANPGPKFCNYDPNDFLIHNWTLGILFDHEGTMGEGVKSDGTQSTPLPNSFIVWNHPFFTAGVTGFTFTPLVHNPQSLMTNKPYMGMVWSDPADDGQQNPNAVPPTGRRNSRNVYQRVDSSGNDIAGAVWDMAAISFPIIGFHHAAVPVGGIVRLSWPEKPKPTAQLFGELHWISPGDEYSYTNPYQNAATDFAIWGVDWATTVSSVVVAGTNASAASNFADLVSKTSGVWYFNDTVKQICWVRVVTAPTLAGVFINP